ncbi:MAG: nucleoside triphosphate pyrophosphohydrolase family protein [Candidatus Aenigmarchaeota archaeon]|nr:nucleoside triphosphate pyrophosphohydrolase family protein [Candidatus Aenigmarchaeota archaeon]
MKNELELVQKFHEKFKAPVLGKPSLIPKDRSEHRHRMMKDEVEEYAEGVEKGDLENIAKELADILYVVYGTILEHGLQDKMEAVFEEVHKSNMSKDYHQYKMVKGPKYVKADVGKILKE